jgi:ribose transport system permease protein
MLLVIIIGGIDLSVGSVVALSATGGAYLLMRDQVPAYAAIGLILSMGLAIGWFNGWVSERFRVPSFVTTLAMLSIARGLAVIWSSRIAVPLSYGEGGADPAFETIGTRIEGVVPVPAIIMFVVAIIMATVLRYSPFGRYLYAIGGNQVAARLSGVAVSRVKITAFMLCGFFATLTGLVHAAQLDQGSPNEAVGYELNAIAAVVIGGASLAGGKAPSRAPSPAPSSSASSTTCSASTTSTAPRSWSSRACSSSAPSPSSRSGPAAQPRDAPQRGGGEPVQHRSGTPMTSTWSPPQGGDPE